VLKTLGDLGLPTKTNLSVPCLTWSFDHPSVPSASEGYVFRADLVDKLAYALSLNEKLWLTGHTGTGKSSLIDEFAARTNWPVVRINFDGEVGRMDLIGREVLRQEDGTTVSQFVDGIIPQAMQQPCILLLDEIDFVRPEVSYVLQRILENDGALVLTEDGGRIVEPHPLFRIVATSNTKGQGDESGHYTGARSQSAAFLDRFTVWGEVPYLESSDLYPAIEAMGLPKTDAISLASYYHEHVQAFINNSIHLPITPRGMLAWAKMFVATSDLRTSFDATILNRGNEADQSVMKGIIDRVVG
jgi:cobaltochelatase CobS subunit